MLLPSLSSVVLLAFFKQKIGLGKSINANVSSETLSRLRRVIFTFGVVLIHDNGLPPSGIVTKKLLEHFKRNMSDHLAYSPDLETSDFNLFPELMNLLGCQIFNTNEEIQSNVSAHLKSLASTFFKEGSET
ncbi:hypothetical protein AVEN_224051-1 [Araneus ventricosus]|uniref:Histone-lysine N-methyltransferase SETMAR n=1 Tax=Araneus ventricosus TaxID=182803 RepID=A0A4Y2S4C1_ARAVE|nr:hypothetical protein AVEN_224051-1 [Araneus ventricosus]